MLFVEDTTGAGHSSKITSAEDVIIFAVGRPAYAPSLAVRLSLTARYYLGMPSLPIVHSTFFIRKSGTPTTPLSSTTFSIAS